MVVAWAQTNANLDGFGINRADGGAPDGAQSAPAIADNTGEFFAVASGGCFDKRDLSHGGLQF